MKKSILIILLFFASVSFAQTSKIVFKVNSEFSSICFNSNIDNINFNKQLSSLGALSISKIFPNAIKPTEEYNYYGEKYVDLSLIYQIEYDKNIINSDIICKALLQSGILEYAEEYLIPKLLFDVNDPQIGSQYHISLIKADTSWSICKGDSSIVIAITDTGTDIDHPDLESNIFYNLNDTIDGIDNDGDGFIDNYRGWDVGSWDNDPSTEVIDHGIFVCGLASAKTNNGIGIAGSGFNCSFLPVKISDANGYLVASYEGIVYAADHGASIINCSWGSNYAVMGAFGNDIVNYATINCDAVVISAAGNDNNDIPFYPASYTNSLSVANTDAIDEKNPNSSYNYLVDISAPGTSVLSTWANGSYLSSSGTSFSSPIAAGILGLIRSHYPSYDTYQARERLRVSCDIIDTISNNQIYKNKLGQGRINALKALTEKSPGFRAFNINLSDGNNNLFQENENIYFYADFYNLLDTSSSLSTIIISSESQYITINDSIRICGQIPTKNKYNNLSNPYIIATNASLPSYPITAWIKVQYIDTNYTSYEYFPIYLNNSFLTLDTNNIELSIANNGMLGYADTLNSLGSGFRHNQSVSLSYLMNFMAATSGSKVSDCCFGLNTRENDFAPTTPITYSSNTLNFQQQISCGFNDDLAINKIGIDVELLATEYNIASRENMLILEYTITNNTTNAISNLYAGIFSDLEINNSVSNRAETDINRKMIYAFDLDMNTYIGLRLLSDGNANLYAIDNDGSSSSINIYDGLSENEKFVALSNNRLSAGQSATGSDVSLMISSGNHTLGVNDTLKIAYALFVGNNVLELIEYSDTAYNIYNGTVDLLENSKPNFGFNNIYPNPASDYSTIEFYSEQNQDISLSVFDNNGKLILNYNINSNKGLNSFNINTSTLKSGIYLCNLSSGNKSISRYLVIE